MKIDFGTAAVGSIATLAFVVPIIMIYLNSKKREKKAFRTLKNLAEKHNGKLNQLDSCADIFIGIDTENKMLFALNLEESPENATIIELSEYKSCQAIETRNEYVLNNEKQTLISKLDLHFVAKNNGRDTKFVLFDLEKKSQLFGELQLAERICKSVNTLM
jgi:hypothetical protein